MVNFNFVEKSDISLKKDAFVDLYNSKSITVEEIRKKLKITRSEHNRLRDECLNEGLIKSRGTKKPKPRPKPKYYQKNGNPYSNRYIVVRKRIYYCTVENEKQAKAMVELLKQCNWDKSKVPILKQQISGLK